MAESKDPRKSWVTPAAALARALRVIPGPINAMDAIGIRLRDGLLKAAAREGITVFGDAPTKQSQNVNVQPVTWAHLQGGWNGQQHLWTIGQVDVWTDRGATRVSLHGLVFDPAGLDAFLGPLEAAALKLAAHTAISSPTPEKHAGGAPRKEFWDDLWLAMFERLWLTNWKPKNKAEIEKAMLDWAAENGHKLGPTSVKIPAGKLLALSKKE